MWSKSSFILPLIIFEIIVANLPTTASLASISYQDDVSWSFLGILSLCQD